MGKMNINPEVLGGIVLLMAALMASVVVNFGGNEIYNTILEHQLQLGFKPLALTKTIHHWINDGLMVLFFLLVGIEINREMSVGSLRKPTQAIMPLAAALGGFILPALIFIYIVGQTSEFTGGWSVPTATDIAFAVALVTALRSRVTASLRVFLLALAVVDDLLAILVIAIFYTTELVWMNLFLAFMAALLLIAKRKFGIQKIWAYVLIGFFMWVCVLKSGVHATLAGVIIGFLLPLTGSKNKQAPAEIFEHALQPFVRWIVLPLFAFANVGINFRDVSIETIFNPLTIGITLALFLGKQVGVFGTVWALNKFGITKPEGASWRQIYGVACMCGIGFTMSLFIGTLALPIELQSQMRIGVVFGSLLSAILATLILLYPHKTPLRLFQNFSR